MYIALEGVGATILSGGCMLARGIRDADGSGVRSSARRSEDAAPCAANVGDGVRCEPTPGTGQG